MNSIILRCDNDESRELWQRRLQGAIYRTSVCAFDYDNCMYSSSCEWMFQKELLLFGLKLKKFLHCSYGLLL